MEHKKIITFGALLFILIAIVGIFIFYTHTKNKPASLSPINNEKVDSLGNNEIANLAISDADAKKFFHATEIISNDSPESIQFWTEAYCPNEGTKYDYQIPSKYASYEVDCTYADNTGSIYLGQHGGCPSCVMASIKLYKKNNTTDYRKPLEQEAENSDKKNELLESLKSELNTLLSKKLLDSDTILKQKFGEYIKKYNQQVYESEEDTYEENGSIFRGLIDSASGKKWLSYIANLNKGYETSSMIFFVEYNNKILNIIPGKFFHGRTGSGIEIMEDMVKGQYPFFTINYGDYGGTCTGSFDTVSLYGIKDGKFKEFGDINNTLSAASGLEIDSKVYFKDLDNDRNKEIEIIGDISFQKCKFNCECEDKILVSEPTHKIMKWDATTETFLRVK